MKICILAAHALELKYVRKSMSYFSDKNIKKKHKITTLKAKNSFDTLNQYDLVLNIGFVGALDPTLNFGQFVLVDQFKEAHNSASISADNDFLKLAQIFLAKYVSYRQGAVLTCKLPILDASKSEFLYKSTKCCAVDMEGFYLGRFLQSKNTAFLSLKIVSDFCDEKSEKLVAEHKEKLAEKLGNLVFEMVCVL